MVNVIVVHGSGVHSLWRQRWLGDVWWWRPESTFCTAIATHAGPRCRLIEFAWSGENSHTARLTAGEQLARRINRTAGTYPREPICLVGHSHGASVALVAINRVDPCTVHSLFLLACPLILVRLGSAQPCDTELEIGSREGPGCGGTRNHWLYWGRAVSGIAGPIYNLYSPQDRVQTTLCALGPGLSGLNRHRDRATVHVRRTFEGRHSSRIHNARIRWRPRVDASWIERLDAAAGIAAHRAMHCERIGALIGTVLACGGPLQDHLARAGLSRNENEITDVGQVTAGDSGSVAPRSIPKRDYGRPPYRVNLQGTRRRPLGVLLVHGLAATPTEFRTLATELHNREPAWAVRSVMLAGHGGTVEDLSRTNEADWLRSVLEGYDELRRRCDRVALVGLSMGAALCCRAAQDRAKHNICTLVLLSPVFRLPRLARIFLELYSFFKPIKEKAPVRARYYKARGLVTHMAFPLKVLEQLDANGRRAWGALTRITAPTLIVFGALDPLVRRKTVASLASQIGRDNVKGSGARLHVADGSGHVLTVEPDADEVLDVCHSFLRYHAPAQESDR